MENEALYTKTVNILVDAYFNDTLEHEDCQCCAVGNLVAANKNIKLTRSKDGSIHSSSPYRANTQWFKAVHCGNVITDALLKNDVAEQILATGYTAVQVAKIEDAFEHVPFGKNEDEWMFNGLMAVIDVLDEIHENTDAAITTTSKSRFKKATA